MNTTYAIYVLIISAISSLLLPLFPYFVLTGIMVVLDTLIAISIKWYLAKKEDKPNPIKSKRLRGLGIKTLIYWLLLGCGAIIQYIFYNDVMTYISIEYFFVKLFLTMIIMWELKSYDEKLRLLDKDKGIMYYIKSLINNCKYLLQEILGIIGLIKDHKEKYKDQSEDK